MSIKLVSSSASETRPVSIQYLSDLLSEATTIDSKELIKVILQNVQKKSSKHKFLAQVTKVSSTNESDCNAGTSFGAIWDNERDGYVCFEVEKEIVDEHKSILISIYWIST